MGSVLDGNGVEQFGITESSTTGTDGSVTENLTVSFAVPAKPEASAAGIPLMGLNAQVSDQRGNFGWRTSAVLRDQRGGCQWRRRWAVIYRNGQCPGGNEYEPSYSYQSQLFVRCEFVQCLPRSQSLPDSANREQRCYRRSVCGFRANCIVAGPCGLQLRPRQLLLAAGTAASRASEYQLDDDDW